MPLGRSCACLDSTGLAEHLVRAAFCSICLLPFGLIRRVGDLLFCPLPTLCLRFHEVVRGEEYE